MTKRLQYTIRTLLFLQALLALVFGIGIWINQFYKYARNPFESLDCGQGRKIIITLDNNEFTSDGELSVFNYRVVVDGQTVQPKTKLCFLSTLVNYDGAEPTPIESFKAIYGKKEHPLGVLRLPLKEDVEIDCLFGDGIS